MSLLPPDNLHFHFHRCPARDARIHRDPVATVWDSSTPRAAAGLYLVPLRARLRCCGVAARSNGGWGSTAADCGLIGPLLPPESG